ncbi:MAG: slipin family protein [Chloroflexaceae bacterium]|nr:slipin family protein [Chloroflexaceae bacterium]
MELIIFGCVALLGFLALMVVLSAIKIVPEYERGVIFRLGRLMGARGPGLFFVVPVLERMVRIDMRTITMDIPVQEVITLDNVTMKVNAVLYFQVIDPNAAVTKVMDFIRATMQIAQTTLRSVVGQVELDDLLAQREKINQKLQYIIDEQTEPWGIKVTTVEIKDVELPSTMQRAMAKQAEAEREKRSKLIHAEGELQASRALAEAANVIASEPTALQLRYLQTLVEISVEKNSTIIFPLPVDTIRPFLNMGLQQSDALALAQQNAPIAAQKHSDTRPTPDGV